jgi:hypothetical protein
MSTRTIYLVAFRESASQRAHFSIFVLSAGDPYRGTLIHVVGMPMRGNTLEFKRNYCPSESRQANFMTSIGDVYEQYIVDSPSDSHGKDSTPINNLQDAAIQAPAPGPSQNFMAPVNDVSIQWFVQVVTVN